MKKFILFLSIVFCAFENNLSAQNVFQKAFGTPDYEEIWSAEQTNDTGFIFGGYTGPLGAFNACLIKTNSSGDTNWVRKYGGIGIDMFYSVKQTTDNGFIAVGRTASFGAGNTDVYLVKTNGSGDTLWTKTYGGTNAETANSIIQTLDTGYLIAGNSFSYSSGGSDFYLIKTDILGNISWSKSYGGGGNDNAYSVIQTSDGNYLAAGLTASFGAGGIDVLLVKLNSFGDTLWAKTYGGAGDDRASAIQETSDGGFVITGVTSSFGSGLYDCYLIKTDAQGNLVWSKAYGGIGNEWSYSLRQTTLGYALLGYTTSFGAGSSDYYLIEANSIGNILWSNAYGGVGSDYGTSLFQTASNDFIITGYSQSFGTGDFDFYIIKSDSVGNINCNQNLSTTIESLCTTIQMTSPCSVLSGGIQGTTQSITSRGITSIQYCSVGHSEFPHGSYSIFPNPSSGKFYLKEVSIGALEVYNILGKKVYILMLNDTKEEVDLSDLSKGIYFIQITQLNKILSAKIIIW